MSQSDNSDRMPLSKNLINQVTAVQAEIRILKARVAHLEELLRHDQKHRSIKE